MEHQQLDLFDQIPIKEICSDKIRFDGSDIIPEMDNKRLTGQILRIYDLMKDGKFRTLSEIAFLTGDHESSISAQLRNLRKSRFGGHVVNKQTRGERCNGLFEYQVL